MTGNPGRFGLYSLCPPDFQSLGGSIRVQGHVLSLERSRMITVLQENTTQGGSQDTLSHIAPGSGKH